MLQIPAQNDLCDGLFIGGCKLQQLRELEEDGIVNRIVYNQVPPKVEYELSEYGWGLQTILDSLCAWGEKHIIREYGDKSAVLEDNILNHLEK